MTTPATFLDEHRLRVGEIDFCCALDIGNAPDGCLPVMKERPLVECHLRLYDDLEPRVIVELGINRGGSTALLHAVNQPDKLVAFELNSSPAAPLARYIEAHGLAATIRPHYGVDQSDRARVASIAATELAGAPIDLVVDDCSHLLAPTLASFEVLFPLVRPGGCFVIEDWNGGHRYADIFSAALGDPDRPGRDEFIEALERAGPEVAVDRGLVHLPLLLVLAKASAGDAVREVVVTEDWVLVRRGADPLDADSFRITDLVTDHFGNLQPMD